MQQLYAITGLVHKDVYISTIGVQAHAVAYNTAQGMIIPQPSAGIYTRPILNATTEIALATYCESFFLNNPLLSRNNDYDGSQYFEFVR